MMQAFAITEVSGIAQARRGVNAFAAQIGFGAEDAGRAALVATEMCTNLVKHGGGGELLAQPIGDPKRPGLELLGLDKGPGMLDMAQCLRDGFSTGGSPGTGLGAIERASQRFDIYSRADRGTALLSQLWPGAEVPERTLDIGAVVIPKPGETSCGDAWYCHEHARGCLVIGVDGLGHGFAAAHAAAEACRVFQAEKNTSPGFILEQIHTALRPTRGAAVTVIDVDFEAGQMTVAGVGNLVAAIVTDGLVKRMASDNGIVGHAMPRIRELAYPCTPASALILHSDGLSASWQPGRYPGLMQHCAALIAGILYRDFTRGRDDALILVVKRDGA